MQESGESLEAFHGAWTAEAARSELGTLESEIVRDLFISKKKNMTLQDTLTFQTLDPEQVLKRAIKFEKVNWLGHHFSESGVSPKFTKTDAIQNLNPPKSLKQLRGGTWG